MPGVRVEPVLVGIPVNGEIEEIGSDPAEIEQGVAFARRTIAANALAFRLKHDQDRQQISLGGPNPICEVRMAERLSKPASRS
jgi:hypothetical protein